MYRFKIKHTPGKHHVGPDATLWYPSASHLCALLLPDQPHHTPDHATDTKQCVTSSLANMAQIHATASAQRMPGAPQSHLKWVAHHKRDPAGSHVPFLANER